MLIVVCGLPAVGKTTVARALAGELGAVTSQHTVRECTTTIRGALSLGG